VIPNIMMVVAFVAGTGLVLTLGLAIRDLFSQRYNVVDHRLSLDASPAEVRQFIRQQEVHGGAVDSWFFRLVEESGTKMDGPTVMSVILGMGVIGGAIPFALDDNLLGAAGGVLIGVMLPVAWLLIKRWRRIRAMRTMLPEALQIIADSVRAGYNLEQSAELASREIKDPLREEFSECASQLKLGNFPTSALQRMARRIPLPEFRVFATAVMVHQTAGGNLALLTQRLSHAALQRQEFVGHLNAVTAGSRLSALGMALGAVAAMAALAWLQPTYVQAFITNELGPYLLALAIALQIIGTIWVWRVSKVTY